MTKRNWTVHVSGWRPFQMVLLQDGPLGYEDALREARGIWPLCNVE